MTSVLKSQSPNPDHPVVSIIIVNWNGGHLLQKCLEAVEAQTFSSFEIVLVDNGSTDGSIEMINGNFTQLKVVRLPENKGFTGGNIKGLEVSEGDFIALLNNDTRVDEKWLENLVQPMCMDSEVGICASKLIVESTGEIDSAGDLLTTWGVGLKRGSGKNPKSYFVEEYVFGACAAAALYRRTMLEDIGFLDEEFFFNDEDTDLNFRAQLRGWKCRFVPTALVHHRVNATIGTMSDLHVYYHSRNLEFLWIKNMPGGLMLRYAHHKILQEIGSFLYLCLRHGKWRAFFKGKMNALKVWPSMLKKRQEIQLQRKVPNQYIKTILLPIFSEELLRQKVRQFFYG